MHKRCTVMVVNYTVLRGISYSEEIYDHHSLFILQSLRFFSESRFILLPVVFEACKNPVPVLHINTRF